MRPDVAQTALRQNAVSRPATYPPSIGTPRGILLGRSLAHPWTLTAPFFFGEDLPFSHVYKQRAADGTRTELRKSESVKIT